MAESSIAAPESTINNPPQPSSLWQKWLDYAWGGRHPSDLSRSAKLLQPLNLSPETSALVLAFRDTRKGPTVYILGGFNLSERSVSDVEQLVEKVKPSAVVVDPGSLEFFQAVKVCAELGPREGVPSSTLEALRRCVSGSATLDEFRTAASDQFLATLFGSTMFGHVTAAEDAAKRANAALTFFTWPPVSLTVDTNPKSEADPETKAETENERSWHERIQSAVQRSFSVHGSSGAASRFHAAARATDGGLHALAERATQLGDSTSSLPTSAFSASAPLPAPISPASSSPASVSSAPTSPASTSPAPSSLTFLYLAPPSSIPSSPAPSSPTPSSPAANSPASSSPASSSPALDTPASSSSTLDSEPPASSPAPQVDFEDQVEEDPPPTSPEFLPPDIHPLLELLTGLLGVREWGDRPLRQARTVMWNMASGEPINARQLADATVLRVAVEKMRLGYCQLARDKAFEPAKKLGPDSDGSQEDLYARTLIHTLKKQAAMTSGDLVALVPASQLPLIRKLWRSDGPEEVAGWSEECVRTPEDFQRGIDEMAAAEEAAREAKEKETWLAVLIAGVGIAGGATYAQGGTLAKVASAVPKTFHLLKAGLALAKRNAATAAAKAVVPQGGAKAGLAAKALAPKTSAAAVKAAAITKLKAAAAAEKMRVVAHGVVSQVQATALRAVRVTGYHVMQRSNFRRPGPWLLLGGSMATGMLAYAYSNELETAVAVLPHAASVARLGRGCENLEKATRELEERRMWPGYYQILRQATGD